MGTRDGESLRHSHFLSAWVSSGRHSISVKKALYIRYTSVKKPYCSRGNIPAHSSATVASAWG